MEYDTFGVRNRNGKLAKKEGKKHDFECKSSIEFIAIPFSSLTFKSLTIYQNLTHSIKFLNKWFDFAFHWIDLKSTRWKKTSLLFLNLLIICFFSTFVHYFQILAKYFWKYRRIVRFRLRNICKTKMNSEIRGNVLYQNEKNFLIQSLSRVPIYFPSLWVAFFLLH